MKKSLIILSFAACMAACRQPTQQSKEVSAAEQLKANMEMEEKVKKVVEQLHRDCDSSLLQLARYKVDSARKAKNISRPKRGKR